MAVYDIGGQRVGIITTENLLITFVGIFHQIGHSLDGIPDGIRREFQRQRLRGERGTGGGGEAVSETIEGETLAALAGDVQRQSLRYQDAVGEDGQRAFLAVREGGCLQVASLNAARDSTEVLRHAHAEMHLLRCTGLHLKRLRGLSINDAQIGIVERVAECERDIAALGDAVHIDHLGRQNQHVALAQEARRVGHHHQLLVGLHIFLETAGHKVRVVRKA